MWLKKDSLKTHNMPALRVIIQQPQNLHRNEPSQLHCELCWQSQYCSAAREREKKVTSRESDNGLFIQELEEEESI